MSTIPEKYLVEGYVVRFRRKYYRIYIDSKGAPRARLSGGWLYLCNPMEEYKIWKPLGKVDLHDFDPSEHEQVWPEKSVNSYKCIVTHLPAVTIIDDRGETITLEGDRLRKVAEELNHYLGIETK